MNQTPDTTRSGGQAPQNPPASGEAGFRDLLIADLRLLLPTRFLSWCMYKLTRIQAPWFKNPFIRVLDAPRHRPSETIR